MSNSFDTQRFLLQREILKATMTVMGGGEWKVDECILHVTNLLPIDLFIKGDKFIGAKRPINGQNVSILFLSVFQV